MIEGRKRTRGCAASVRGAGLATSIETGVLLLSPARKQKAYYERLTYIAADKSERMLTDVLRPGVIANHPGRYIVRSSRECP